VVIQFRDRERNRFCLISLFNEIDVPGASRDRRSNPISFRIGFQFEIGLKIVAMKFHSDSFNRFLLFIRYRSMNSGLSANSTRLCIQIQTEGAQQDEYRNKKSWFHRSPHPESRNKNRSVMKF